MAAELTPAWLLQRNQVAPFSGRAPIDTTPHVIIGLVRSRGEATNGYRAASKVPVSDRRRLPLTANRGVAETNRGFAHP